MNSNLSEAKQIYDLPSEGYKKLEILIGRVRLGKFTGNVSDTTFERLRSELDLKVPAEISITTDYNQDGIRHTVDQIPGQDYWTSKEQLYSKLDLTLGYQITVSVEKELEPIENFKPIFSRNKTRYSYNLGSGRVNLTKVDGASNEVELEYIKEDFGGLFNTIMGIVQNSPLLYTYPEVNLLNQNLRRLFKSPKITVSSRRDVKYKDLVFGGIVGNTETGYSVSHFPKGQRKLLIISNGIWLYFPQENDIELSLISRTNMVDYEGSVIDGINITPEFRTESGADSLYWFAMTDALMIGGDDVRSENAQQRRTRGMQVLQAINNSLLTATSLLALAINTPGEFFSNNVDLIRQRNLLGYKSSGLIFSPINVSYNSPPGKKRGLVFQPETVTWKYPSELSIDFKVVQRSLGQVNLMVRSGNREVPFEGTLINPLSSDWLPEMTQYPTGTIVEMGLVTNSNGIDYLEVLRVRNDKSTPNDLVTASSIWDSIFDPIDPEVLTGESNELYKKYHSRVRRQLYEKAVEKQRLLVVNAGHGQDITSWMMYDRIVAITNEFKELTDRITTFKLSNKVHVIRGDYKMAISKSSEVMEYLGGNPTTVSFMNDTIGIPLSSITEISDMYLQKNGTLILSVLDGDYVSQAMNPVLGGVDVTEIQLIDRATFNNFNGTTFDLTFGGNTRTVPVFRLDPIIIKLQSYGFGRFEIVPFDTEKLLPIEDLKLTRFFNGMVMVRNSIIRTLPSIQYPSEILDLPVRKLTLPVGGTKVSMPSIYFPPIPRTYRLQGIEQKYLGMLISKEDAYQDLNYTYYPNIIRMATLGDGSCYLHSILLGFDIWYQENNSVEERIEYVKNLRRDLALGLKDIDPTSTDLTYYQTSADGSWTDLAKSNVTFDSRGKTYNYSLESLSELINSGEYLGDEIFDYFNRQLNVDVWIFEAYIDHLVPINRPDTGKKIVIVISIGNHYELLAIKRSDRKLGLNPDQQDNLWIQTWFTTSDPFISALRQI